MTYHLRCGHCDERLYCEHCGEPVEADDPIPGQVGSRHSAVVFDPTRRKAWDTQRGRILLDLYSHEPALCREIWPRIGISSSNQVCTRMGELGALGLTQRTGVERPTETGTPADEWVLSRQGREMVESANGNRPEPPPRRKRVIPPPR